MYKVNPLIIFRKEFDGNGLLFNPDNGETFALNRTAAAIYEQLEAGKEEAEILTELAARTNLPPKAAEDLKKFLSQLRAKGYIAES